MATFLVCAIRHRAGWVLRWVMAPGAIALGLGLGGAIAPALAHQPGGYAPRVSSGVPKPPLSPLPLPLFADASGHESALLLAQARVSQPPFEFERYRLGPGDSVFVNVLRFPDLTFQGTLDVEGNLLVPLVGALSLEGLTLAQARARLRTELNRYVVDPQVDVILVAQRPVRVTVLGEVARPGLYALESADLSVALVSAGGTTSQADLRAVRLRRLAPNGISIERTVDLFTPLKTATALPTLRLEDGDTIVVPVLTADARDDYDASLVSRSTLAQPQITVRVLDYSNSRGGGNRNDRALTNVALPNGSTFLDAIANASPNLDTADLSDIALIRFDPDRGEAITQEYNARRALRGDGSQNPPLQHNDVIVIGRNLIGRITYALSTFTQPFRDTLGFLLFFDALTNSADNLFSP